MAWSSACCNDGSGWGKGVADVALPGAGAQQCLYFLPLPQGQGWFREGEVMDLTCLHDGVNLKA